MISRADKYSKEEMEGTSVSMPTRCSRNSRLYKEVYGKYGEWDHLPIEDNTDEIDMERLKELVSHKEQPKQSETVGHSLNILEKRKRQIDEQKVYDINQILEKAKYENSKLKEPVSSLTQESRNILSTLEGTEVSARDIEKASHEYRKQKLKKEASQEEKLSMTRELKNRDLVTAREMQENPLVSEMKTANDLSLDLFQDLKPTDNTITTKPIREDEEDSSVGHMDFHSEDTRDIDIIKASSDKKMDNDFFTSSYEFSKKDFSDDDDFLENSKHGGLFKVLLLILAITIFIGVIVYFVGTYGMGMA